MIGSTNTSYRLRHLENVIARLVDANEKRNVDVGADVVLADEPLFATPVDLNGLDGNIHHLGAMYDGKHHRARKRHERFAFHRVDDERLPLQYLAVKARNDGGGSQRQKQQRNNGNDDRNEVTHGNCPRLVRLRGSHRGPPRTNNNRARTPHRCAYQPSSSLS